MNSKRYFSESDKQKARKNTFILIGITGKGKSQIIKFLTGDPDAKVKILVHLILPYIMELLKVMQITKNFFV